MNTFILIYPDIFFPSDVSDEVSNVMARAASNPNGYVLKPQREGGGNNFYKQVGQRCFYY